MNVFSTEDVVDYYASKYGETTATILDLFHEHDDNWYLLEEVLEVRLARRQRMRGCSHDYVNVSFNHIVIACKHCGEPP